MNDRWPSCSSRVRTRARRPRNRRKCVGLGQRTLGPGRGDLERVPLADLGQRVRDALAELERDALGMVDEQAHRAAAEHLGEQHLDVRLALGELALDLVLDGVLINPPPVNNEKAGERPLPVHHRRTAAGTEAVRRE